MKKSKSCVLLLVFFVFPIFSFVSAQTAQKAEIRRIEAYRKTIDAFVKRDKSPHLIFADAADYTENEKPKWRRYNSEREFEKASEAAEFYDIAYVWRRNGRVVMANFTRSSPSGDWVQYIFHYFRPDGSLAKLESELRTFYGNLIVEQNFYFDRRGKILQKTRKFLDLQTQKPKKPTKDDMMNNGDRFNQVIYYKHTNRLPFAALVRRKK